MKQASGENEKAKGMENLKGKSSNASAEQYLDKFLLGDLEDSDGVAGILVDVWSCSTASIAI